MTKLSDLCEIKTNFPDADFWIVRRGSVKTVGKPSNTYYSESIGIKVIATDKVVPQYLFYWFEFLHSRGVFEQLAHGTLALVNIKTTDIRDLPVSFR